MTVLTNSFVLRWMVARYTRRCKGHETTIKTTVFLLAHMSSSVTLINFQAEIRILCCFSLFVPPRKKSKHGRRRHGFILKCWIPTNLPISPLRKIISSSGTPWHPHRCASSWKSAGSPCEIRIGSSAGTCQGDRWWYHLMWKDLVSQQ